MIFNFKGFKSYCEGRHFFFIDSHLPAVKPILDLMRVPEEFRHSVRLSGKVDLYYPTPFNGAEGQLSFIYSETLLNWQKITNRIFVRTNLGLPYVNALNVDDLLLDYITLSEQDLEHPVDILLEVGIPPHITYVKTQLSKEMVTIKDNHSSYYTFNDHIGSDLLKYPRIVHANLDEFRSKIHVVAQENYFRSSKKAFEYIDLVPKTNKRFLEYRTSNKTKFDEVSRLREKNARGSVKFTDSVLYESLVVLNQNLIESTKIVGLENIVPVPPLAKIIALVNALPRLVTLLNIKGVEYSLSERDPNVKILVGAFHQFISEYEGNLESLKSMTLADYVTHYAFDISKALTPESKDYGLVDLTCKVLRKLQALCEQFGTTLGDLITMVEESNDTLYELLDIDTDYKVSNIAYDSITTDWHAKERKRVEEQTPVNKKGINKEVTKKELSLEDSIKQISENFRSKD